MTNSIMTDSKKLGLLITLKRKKKGISQSDLATMCNVTKQTIYNYECGMNMRLGIWMSISKILNITQEEVYNINETIEVLWDELNPIRVKNEILINDGTKFE